jgi:hypothetical protein
VFPIASGADVVSVTTTGARQGIVVLPCLLLSAGTAAVLRHDEVASPDVMQLVEQFHQFV